MLRNRFTKKKKKTKSTRLTTSENKENYKDLQGAKTRGTIRKHDQVNSQGDTEKMVRHNHSRN